MAKENNARKRTHTAMIPAAIWLFASACGAWADTVGQDAPEAAPFEPEETSCAFFMDERWGELSETTLRLPRWGEAEQTITLRYRSDYLRQPYIPDTIDGSLPRTQSFEMYNTSGEPLPRDRSIINQTRPKDYKHLSMLVTGAFDRPIWILLNRIDGLDSREDDEYVTLSNGDRIRVPNNFFVIGDYVSDFKEISWPFKLDEYQRKFEYSIRYNNMGEIEDTMECMRGEYYVNPLCLLSFRNLYSFVKVTFNKTFLGEIDIFRNNTKKFHSCITKTPIVKK